METLPLQVVTTSVMDAVKTFITGILKSFDIDKVNGGIGKGYVYTNVGRVALIF